MQTQIERLMDGRIAVLSLSGDICQADSDILRDVLADVFAAQPTPIFLIIDARHLRVSFQHLNAFMRQQRVTRSLENTYATQLQLPPIYVGTSPLTETYVSIGLPHSFRMDRSPSFSTRDEAMDYVRVHQRRQAQA